MNVWNIIEAISIFAMFACIVVLAVINERLRRALEWELEKNTRRIRVEQILKEEAKKPPCILREAPTIDAVQVVRCKDCKYRKVSEYHYKDIGYRSTDCTRGNEGVIGTCEDDGYCSLAERKAEP